MPFAEDARRVTSGLQNLREGHGLQAHPLALVDGVRDAGFELMPAGHQRTPRRRTGRADVKIRESPSFVVKAIEVRCFEDRITVTGKVPIALIVGKDQNDIGR